MREFAQWAPSMRVVPYNVRRHSAFRSGSF